MNFLTQISTALWNPGLFILFFFVGGYFTLQTGCFQLFHAKTWLGKTIGPMLHRKKSTVEKGRLTQFQAMATALGSIVGTSTIAGVATAIYFGGPGAVFWMWMSAFVGMMTSYAEKVLAIHYRTRDKNGVLRGGPPEYIRRGLHAPWMAKWFCFACILASFCGGNLVQANSIASGMKAAFNVAPNITGGVVAGVTALVIFGGIGRIGRVSSALVPFMALVFIGGGLFVLAAHAQAIPTALCQIVTCALTPQAAVCGGGGYAVSAALRYGVARGVFTNEAGLGSSAMAHAVADAKSEHNQGMWGILEVFLATLVIATISALVILTSGIYQAGDALRTLESGLLDPDMVGVPLAVRSFGTVMGGWSGPFIAICLVLFAFSSILGWSYYGERCLEELLGSERGRGLYRLLYVCAIVFGSISDVSMCWDLADLCNGLMALPNLIAVLLLSPKVIQIFKEETAKDKIKAKRTEYRRR